MKDILEYKGYQGTVEFSKDDNCLYGKVIGIKSLIIYEGQTVKELIDNFHNFVDEYLETCKKNKIVPEKPFKGNFNVRINPELHKKAVIIANKQGISLNKFIEHAVRNMIAI